MRKMYKYTIGIDEAGRGPLAGPVAVGVVLMSANFNKKLFSSVRDSKQLTKIGREKWFEKIKENKNIRYIVCFTDAGQIDKFGIVSAIKKAMNRALKKFEVAPNKCKVLLDGTLKAPKEFKNQKTIIKGDEKELVISLASIAAKVERDKKMINFSKKYPKYNFEKHKGYGTKEHYKKIKKHGICDIHRRSFVNLLKKQ
ncbi:MAG: ribonuclease HII [Candidatus Pacebacteria bacterium]|jgi:ribonuclease HII|nr:ribonuclease HII [Parcubacteria group bacterium]MDP6249319.1 ribonuclease HII [Candidatus Paceibacterota bacterium]MDP7159455.1 ribonuclease HII [Candidatus Paceibacterota bacterium]MDP7466250.1 ribonuclease HII [Candidatus Paceibacterota bacterium]MDP7648332.1 ribonuclease HII [Candidatus Paceibacterota bacterium]|tara:strand:+ start:8859 stop:9452 length:594 start_codon:yes stop_codon:yes gene_type:complete